MKTLIKLAAFAATLMFTYSCSNSETTPKSVDVFEVKTDSASIKKAEDDRIANQKKAFFNSYQSCKSSLSEKIDLTSKDDVWTLFALFNVYAEHLHDYRNNKDADIVAVYSDYKKCLSQLQVKLFPLMRKAYLVEAKNMLFRHNIEVSASKPYTTVMFTGYLFADNANIEDVNNMVWQQLVDLRFKQVRYRWSKVDDEYTYYTVKSSADKDIIFK